MCRVDLAILNFDRINLERHCARGSRDLASADIKTAGVEGAFDLIAFQIAIGQECRSVRTGIVDHVVVVLDIDHGQGRKTLDQDLHAGVGADISGIADENPILVLHEENLYGVMS